MSKKPERIIMADPDLPEAVRKKVAEAVKNSRIPDREIFSGNAVIAMASMGMLSGIISTGGVAPLYLAAGAAVGAVSPFASRREIRQIKVNCAARKAYLDKRYRKGAYVQWKQAEDLVQRAHRASLTVTTSEVHKADQIDSAHNNLVLPRQLWDLMGDLEALDEHIAKLPQGSGAAFEAHGKIVEQIQVNCERRVIALETYAEQVVEADARYAEMKAIQLLESSSEGLMDLLARTSAVDAQIAEVGVLTGQAAALVEGYRTALAAAREAGLALTAGVR